MVNIPNSGVPITGALKIAKDWYQFFTEFKRDTISASLFTARGQIIRRGATAPEGLAAQTANTFLGGDGTDVTTRTAAQVRTSLNTISGTYTPTLFNTTNVAASTAVLCHYTRVDSVVMVSGYVEVDPTAAAGTATKLGMSIPVASNFASSIQLTGVALSYPTAQMGEFSSDAANDRASLDFLASNTANAGWRFIFAYQVI